MNSQGTRTVYSNVNSNGFSRVLPGSPVEKVKQLLQHRMSVEGDVNGLWLAILKAWFPLEGSLNAIKPEKRDEPDIPTEGHHKYTSLIPGYIDLLVTHQIFTHKGVQSPWRVIYEGKGSEGESLDGAFTQLQKYGTDGMPPGTVCFAIAAKGTTCRFWRFFRRPNEERIKLQSLGLGTSQDSDDVVIVPEGQHGPVYDLQRQEHLIAHILEYIHTQTSRRSG